MKISQISHVTTNDFENIPQKKSHDKTVEPRTCFLFKNRLLSCAVWMILYYASGRRQCFKVTAVSSTKHTKQPCSRTHIVSLNCLNEFYPVSRNWWLFFFKLHEIYARRVRAPNCIDVCVTLYLKMTVKSLCVYHTENVQYERCCVL